VEPTTAAPFIKRFVLAGQTNISPAFVRPPLIDSTKYRGSAANHGIFIIVVALPGADDAEWLDGTCCVSEAIT